MLRLSTECVVVLAAYGVLCPPAISRWPAGAKSAEPLHRPRPGSATLQWLLRQLGDPQPGLLGSDVPVRRAADSAAEPAPSQPLVHTGETWKLLPPPPLVRTGHIRPPQPLAHTSQTRPPQPLAHTSQTGRLSLWRTQARPAASTRGHQLATRKRRGRDRGGPRGLPAS